MRSIWCMRDGSDTGNAISEQAPEDKMTLVAALKAIDHEVGRYRYTAQNRRRIGKKPIPLSLIFLKPLLAIAPPETGAADKPCVPVCAGVPLP